MRNRRGFPNRRGFTLTELMIVVVLVSVIGTALTLLLMRQQRFHRAVVSITDARARMRDVATILPTDLRSISTSSADILAFDVNSIQFRAFIGTSIVCNYPSAQVIELPPKTLASGNVLTAWINAPGAGDVAYVYDNGAMAGNVDDTWRRFVITDTVSSTDASWCSSALSPAFTTAADNAARRYRITLNGAPDQTRSTRGDVIRFAREVRYSAYQASDNHWYVGYQTCTANANPTLPGACGTVEMLAGPIQPASQDTTTSGLFFVFYRKDGSQVTAHPYHLALATAGKCHGARQLRRRRLAALRRRLPQPHLTPFPLRFHRSHPMNRSTRMFSRIAGRRLSARRGFAMMMALGALVIIAVLIAGSSYISLQESRLGQNQLVQARAISAAEYGLNKIQADWDKTPNLQMNNGASYDMQYDVPGQGSCKVRMTRLNNQTFWLVSEGRAVAGAANTQTRTAVKRVGAILRLRIPTIQANAAITAGGNVTVRGGADIFGNDSHPPEWTTGECAGPLTNKAGVLVPPGAQVTTQGSSTISGAPAWDTSAVAANPETYWGFGDENWTTLTAQAIAAGMYFPTGGTIGNDVKPSVSGGYCNKGDKYNWGEPHRPPAAVGEAIVPECYNYFPIIYSKGDLTLNGKGRGQGILLVEGNVTINGHFEWHGLIVVTNDIVRGTGSAEVYGGVMARNEVKADESVISGTTSYRYSSCALERAMRGSAQVVQARDRAWAELY
jgi:prepilin-type N-terminal cleavage/methylation domain-containing protein